jgi:hypothetical protein
MIGFPSALPEDTVAAVVRDLREKPDEPTEDAVVARSLP